MKYTISIDTSNLSEKDLRIFELELQLLCAENDASFRKTYDDND